MRKRPFLLLACMFLAGILLCGYHIWIPAPVLLLSGWFVFRQERGVRRRILLAAAPVFLLAGAFCMGGRMRFRGRYLPELEDGQEIRLVGEVAWIEEKPRCVYVYLTDCVLSSRMPCNDVLAYASTGEFSVGQILTVRGMVALFRGAPNEGGFDAARFYQSRGIDFSLRDCRVERVCREARPWQRALFGLRARLQRSIEECGGADGLLAAMLLGEKAGLDSEVKQLYQRAGIGHILAISGLHVTLLGIGFYRLLRRLGLRCSTAGGLAALFVSAYGILTGGSVPTVRAAAMVLLFLFADVLGRGYDMLNALGLVCIVLLWENPFLVGYTGFWFSVLAVLGVGAVGPVLTGYAMHSGEEETRPPGEKKRVRMARAAQESLWMSLGIQLATLPLVAHSYCEIPVYALLINMIVLPLAKYLLALGCAAAVLGMVSAAVGSFFMAGCNRILWLYEMLCDTALKLPGARLIAGCPHPWQILAYYLLLSVLLLFMHRRTQARAGPVRVLAVLCGVLGLSAALVLRPAGGFEIDVLDVGQGDGIYLRTESGISLFIDGGSTDVAGVGANRILPFLKYRGVKKITCWLVSHADNDHVNGLEEVLGSGYPVEHLILAEAARWEERTAALAALAERCGTQVHYMQAGDCLQSGETVLRCLYPEGGDKSHGNPTSEMRGGKADLNALSLVLVLEYRDFRGIFTGDIPEAVERELLERSACAPVNFYKAAHHGSKFSNSRDFLQALRPGVAVISYGRDNRFGHPHPEAVERIAESGANIFLTPECGQITVKLRDERLLTVIRRCPP